MSVFDKVGARAAALRLESQGGATACARLLKNKNLLGGALFAASLDACAATLPGGFPVAVVAAPPLTDPACEGEFWFVHPASKVSQGLAGDDGALRYRHDGRLLFGLITLEESAFAGAATSALQAATESAYSRVFSLMEELGYPHLLRCWNYFSDINGDGGGLERYRQFNIGRQQAFTRFSRATADHVPAACALGVNSGPLTVFFLVSRDFEPIAVENPRQVSAYHYPSDYGPRAPTFARAALVPMDSRWLLLISGTASIVGHQSVHIGDVVAQTHEAVTNIEAVLAEAQRASGGRNFSFGELDIRVYVRHAKDLSAIEAVLNERLVGAARAPKVVYLRADVCRSDLLVEIEAAGFAAD